MGQVTAANSLKNNSSELYTLNKNGYFHSTPHLWTSKQDLYRIFKWLLVEVYDLAF